TPSLESVRVLSLSIRVTFLASRFPSTTIHQPPKVIQSNSHNCLKISPNSTIISTTADHHLVSP
ncbi:hypothetical protein GW17_00053758, partial [Ensete ventricosum]